MGKSRSTSNALYLSGPLCKLVGQGRRRGRRAICRVRLECKVVAVSTVGAAVVTATTDGRGCCLVCAATTAVTRSSAGATAFR